MGCAMRQLFHTDDSWTGPVLRLTLGLVTFPHGAQKMLGWYGGFGFSVTMGFFMETMHLPWIVALLEINRHRPRAPYHWRGEVVG